MRIRWFGQSAFLLEAEGHTVLIDPFGQRVGGGDMRFAYPPIAGVRPDVVIITHEHGDHNAVEVAEGQPVVVRARAGTYDTPIGPVVLIASEHDAAAGTQRGPNTIACFQLDGQRICHFGDFGQPALRPEQGEVIDVVDLLLIPVGGRFTIDGVQAAALTTRLRPRVVVPMHYRTAALNFLETADAFLGSFRPEQILRLTDSTFSIADLPASPDKPLVVVPAAPPPSAERSAS